MTHEDSLSPPASSAKARWRRRLLLVLVLGIGAALVSYFDQDLERFALEKALAWALQAKVDLGAVERDDDGRWTLQRLEIRKWRDFPTVENLRIETLILEGRWAELRDFQARRLTVQGVDVEIDVSRPFVLPPSRIDPRIDALSIEPIRLVLKDAEQTTLADGRITITDYGWIHPTGQIDVNASRFDLPLLRSFLPALTEPPLDGTLEAAELQWTFDDMGSTVRLQTNQTAYSLASITLQAPALEIDGEFVGARTSWTVRTPRLDITSGQANLALDATSLRLDAEETATQGWFLTAQLEQQQRMSGPILASLSARFAPDSQRFSDLDLQFEDLELRTLTEALATGPWPLGGIVLGGNTIDLDALEGTMDVKLSGDPDDLAYDLDLDLQHWPKRLAPWVVGPASASAVLHGQWRDLEDGPRATFAGTITVPKPPASLAISLPGELFPIRLSAEGEWTGGEERVLGTVRLRPAQGGEIQTRGEARWTDEPAIDGRFSWDGTDIPRILDWLEDLGVERPDFDIDGQIRAAGTLSGPATDPKIGATLEWQSLKIASDSIDRSSPQNAEPWQAESETGRVRLERSRSAAPWRWQVPTTEGTWSWSDRPTRSFQVEVAGTLASDRTLGTFDGLQLDLGSLGTLGGAGTWTSPHPARLDATLEAKGLAVRQWGVWSGRLDEGMTVSGELAGDWDLAFDAEDGWRIQGETRLARGGYASEDGARVIDGLSGTWELHLAQALGQPLTFAARGRAGRLQLLWNTFYGDLSEMESIVDLAGRLEPLEVALRGHLPAGPRFEGTVRLDEQGLLEAELNLTEEDLNRTHQRYLRSLLQEALGDLEMAGEIGLQLSTRIQTRPTPSASALETLVGQLDIRGFALQTPMPLEITDLDLELPFELHAETDGQGSTIYRGPELEGRLRLPRLTIRDLILPPIETPLTAEGDAIALTRPLEIDTLGGVLSLQALTAEELLGAAPAMTSQLRWSGVRLDLLAERLGLFPLEGTIEASLPSVRLSANGRLEVIGGGEAQLFGGRVLVREISGRDLFTRFPKLGFSADFERLDLGQLTRRFDFGEMTGLLNGTIEGAETFRGVPTAFSARFATVREPGAPQRLDLKAIKNLTILGTGSSPSLFDRGILQIFDSYRYAGFGFATELVGDTLTIRGLEKRDDRQLFLRGRFPLRIDIVNARPNVEVSFRGMLNRLRNLDVSDIRTE